jgi:hypothetical protein
MAVRPNETARCYEMEINLNIPKVIIISWQPSPTQKMIKKIAIECAIFQLLGQHDNK